MPALQTPKAQTGWKAPAFSLPGTDGNTHTLESVKGPRGLVVMFICNHCPYVQAIVGDLARDMAELKQHGIASVAIMPNDVENYPEDSFANMVKFAQAHRFTFPYLIDESQAVAKAYGAVCTPDFFGFDANLQLQYRGRLNATTPGSRDSGQRELYNAMVQIADTGSVSGEQTPSIGCSIKWK